MFSAPDVLNKIIAHKQTEIAKAQSIISLNKMREMAEVAPKCRGFVDAIRNKIAQKQPAVIAEIKKASPSKGVLRIDFDPETIAQSYAQSGAACLSVLTDEHFFKGHIDYLKTAKSSCDLPVLRKDFMVDSYQVYEAKAIGADCILLIAAVLDFDTMSSFKKLAYNLGMDVLVEVHNLSELKKSLPLDLPLIGINNRNLHDFSINLQTTIDLLPHIGSDRIVVTESGILSQDDVRKMRDQGIESFLVGEAFMRADDCGAALVELFCL